MKFHKYFYSTHIFWLLFCMPVLCVGQTKKKGIVEKPNIIFVLVDDLRWDAMGFMGRYPFLKTPHIDQLRKEGVHFKNAYCTNSLCAPSRATFLTGMFPQTHGVNTNQEGRELNPDKTLSFGQILQGEGYATAYYGYMWADVLTSDAAEAFAEAPGGFYDKELAAKMVKYLFAPRNSIDPAEAYRNFRGRDAKIDAIMRDRGFPIPKK